MCYSEGSLQALLDGQVTRDEKRRMEEHLQTCQACRETLKRLQEAQEFASGTLGAYLDAGEDNTAGEPAKDAAWGRVSARLSLDDSPLEQRDAWWMEVMRVFKRSRALTAAAATVMALAIALSFGPVRATASRFLSIFRVSRFETVNVSPADLNRVEQALRDGSGSVDVGNLGKLEVHSNGRSGMISVEQAKQAVDFQVRLPSAGPNGYELQGVSSQAGGTVSLTLDVNKANQALKSIGATTMLPADLDGQTFSVRMPVVIDAQYGSASSTSDAIHFLQARSPELDVPGNSTPNAVKDAVLSLPFVPDSVKKQVASIGDWQHTFLVPNIQGSTQEVTVDGSQGVYMTAPAQLQGQMPDVKNALVWEKNGVVYAIMGTFGLNTGLAMANSMK